MKSYKEIAQAAGVDVDTVREVAKTVYEDVTGWHEVGYTGGNPWAPGYRTKSEAIEAACKRKKAEAAEATKAETGLSLETLAEALSEVNPGGVTVDDIIASYVHECVADWLDVYRKARDVMAAHGMEIPADPGEAMRIAENLHALARVKGVSMERLDAGDVETAAHFDGYMVLTVKTAPKTTVIVRDMARYDGRTWETAHFGAIPDGMSVQAEALAYPENWQIPMLMFGAIDERGDVNAVLSWSRRNGTRDVFEADAHKDGARLEVEVSKIIGGGESNSLLTLWDKRGHIPSMREAWNVDTCVLEADGGAHGGWPNPQHKRNGTTDFEWVLEATPANRFRLLVETLRRWAE